jgi:hypothetical protein
VTERKPRHVSFDTWIEAQIREAQDRGEFENLPGKGKPLAAIDGPPDAMWWVKQLMVRERLSYLPPALAVRREAEKLLEELADVPSEAKLRQAVGELNDRIREMNRSRRSTARRRRSCHSTSTPSSNGGVSHGSRWRRRRRSTS